MSSLKTQDKHRSLKVVSIGGGHGQSLLLKALKRITPNITAIVTTFDSGGSSGLLSREFGVPPFGDIRRCLVALAPTDTDIKGIVDIMNYRFPQSSSLRGHAMGNLVLASLTERHHSLYGAVKDLSATMKLTGRVVPVAREYSELIAHFKDGTELHGEANIDTRNNAMPLIEKITLSDKVAGNPEAISAVEEADAVFLGPGDLYTSVLPNLLPEGITTAMAISRAKFVYITNLMTKHGETDSYTATEFVERICRYTTRAKLNYVLVNKEMVPPMSAEAYAAEHAMPVEVNLEELKKYTDNVLEADLLDVSPETGAIQHHIEKLLKAVRTIL